MPNGFSFLSLECLKSSACSSAIQARDLLTANKNPDKTESSQFLFFLRGFALDPRSCSPLTLNKLHWNLHLDLTIEQGHKNLHPAFGIGWVLDNPNKSLEGTAGYMDFFPDLQVRAGHDDTFRI